MFQTDRHRRDVWMSHKPGSKLILQVGHNISAVCVDSSEWADFLNDLLVLLTPPTV